jgi:hypothetical protein
MNLPGVGARGINYAPHRKEGATIQVMDPMFKLQDRKTAPTFDYEHVCEADQTLSDLCYLWRKPDASARGFLT